MKKKVIIPIVLGSISLLFGGLIYLGISAFPELLLSEEQLKAQEAERMAAVNNRAVFNDEPSNGAIVLNDGAFGLSDNYVPSSLGEEAITSSISLNSREVKLPIEKTFDSDFALVEYVPVFEDATYVINVNHESSVEEHIIKDEHVSYYSHAEYDESTKVTKVNKAKVNKNQALRSNQAVVETSLLVIGAVDIFSMILIKRKKHLFH